MGDKISGGNLLGFESYFIPADSAYLGMREYEITGDKVKPQTEAVYYPEEGNNNLMNSVLFDIFNCEQDLISHCDVEDYMFVPAVLRLEKKLSERSKDDGQ